MKAIIVEMGKDYCIVITRDGQFLKQRMPAGVFELGDEIVVSKEYSYKPALFNITWIKKMSLAASVAVVVVTVSIFSVLYLGHYASSRDEVFTGNYITVEDTADKEDDLLVGEIEKESYEESGLSEEEVTREVSVSEDAAEKTVVFKKVYSFAEQTEVEDDIEDVINFSYKIINNSNLRIKLRNISASSSFSGSINMIISLSDNSESRVEEISLEEFEPGRIEEYPLFLKAGESKLEVEITGIAR